jgi:diphosphomevalonate decarboxylase
MAGNKNLPEVTTAIGSSNIAFVKYWGKRDNKLNLPNNSSISMTLDDNVSTKTSIIFTDELEEDIIYINNKKQNFGKDAPEKLRFIKNAIDYSRNLSKVNGHALIVSINNFPTSSGLASSASGGATLIYALNHALHLKLSEKEMSIAARKISGSACRSLYGGIVKWEKGKRKDGIDSYATQIVNERYWPELIDIIAITDFSIKKISSSIGHDATVKTSTLYNARLKSAEEEFRIVHNAVLKKDFNSLGKAIMRESNNMHATMLDTYPPIIYLNDTSRSIIYAVHELNEKHKKCVAAYTFDAGPNAHIITTNKYKQDVLNMLNDIDKVRDIIQAKSGSGPTILEKEDSLIDINSLSPLKNKISKQFSIKR